MYNCIIIALALNNKFPLSQLHVNLARRGINPTATKTKPTNVGYYLLTINPSTGSGQVGQAQSRSPPGW